MPRSTPEWIGATADTKVPPRVRLRVFNAWHNNCATCTRAIRPAERWTCDHILALINGGENRENNLQPLCRNCDLSKTATDVKLKSRAAQRAKSHRGVKKTKKKMGYRLFDGTPVFPSRS